MLGLKLSHANKKGPWGIIAEIIVVGFKIPFKQWGLELNCDDAFYRHNSQQAAGR